MSVYNPDLRLLDQAVQSILRQTYEDFEFLIADDGSTQELVQSRLHMWAELDPRIKSFRKTNEGLTITLNRLAYMSRGNYLARMDADDISQPLRLEYQVSYMDVHPEVAVVGAWTEFIDEKGSTLFYKCPKTTWNGDVASQPIHSTVMLRKSVFMEIGGYDERFSVAQDYELWTRIATRHVIANVPKVLLGYRLREDNITSTRMLDQIRAYWLIRQLAHLSDDEKQRAWDRLCERSHRDPDLLSQFHFEWNLRKAGTAWVHSKTADARQYYRAAIRQRPLHVSVWARYILTWLLPRPPLLNSAYRRIPPCEGV